jgi:hypothetical protein
MEHGNIEAAFAWAERSRARAFADALATDGQTAVSAIQLHELQRQLPEKTAVLCIFTTGVLENDMPMLRKIPQDNPLHAYLLLPAQTICFLITKDDCHARLTKLNPNLFSANSPRGFDVARLMKTAVLSHLYKSLCHFDELDFTNYHITVVPHGPLHRVPFTAVFAAGLGQLPRLTYAPSCTLLQFGQTHPSQQGGALAVGYNGTLNGQPLRYTEAEVVEVSRLLQGQAIIGLEPKKERLRALAAQQQWLHFACHGFFDTQQPMRSYLQTGEGEQLTAEEILNSWTLDARLVILSACETAVSHILRGDEPMGLIRAFLYAGAQAVLATQWSVDDLATALFMGRFYRTVTANPEGALADALVATQQWLQSASRETIQQLAHAMGLDGVDNGRLQTLPNDAPFADPIYWAGFQLVMR